MAQLCNDEIIKFASEHGMSYQEAWRTLMDSKVKIEHGKPDIGFTTKFCMKEKVILPNNERGEIISVYKAKSWTEPKYSVMTELGHVKTFAENDIKATQ